MARLSKSSASATAASRNRATSRKWRSLGPARATGGAESSARPQRPARARIRLLGRETEPRADSAPHLFLLPVLHILRQRLPHQLLHRLCGRVEAGGLQGNAQLQGFTRSAHSTPRRQSPRGGHQHHAVPDASHAPKMAATPAIRAARHAPRRCVHASRSCSIGAKTTCTARCHKAARAPPHPSPQSTWRTGLHGEAANAAGKAPSLEAGPAALTWRPTVSWQRQRRRSIGLATIEKPCFCLIPVLSSFLRRRL